MKLRDDCNSSECVVEQADIVETLAICFGIARNRALELQDKAKEDSQEPVQSTSGADQNHQGDGIALSD